MSTSSGLVPIQWKHCCDREELLATIKFTGATLAQLIVSDRDDHNEIKRSTFNIKRPVSLKIINCFSVPFPFSLAELLF